eukprot:scaffold27253_cov73-Phaeocystis_antarctica.AAC.3
MKHGPIHRATTMGRERRDETLSVLPSLDTTHPPAAFPYTTRCTSPASPPSGRQTHNRGS